MLLHTVMWGKALFDEEAGVAVQDETKYPLMNTSHHEWHPPLITNFFANSNMNTFTVHQWDSEAINSGAFV